MPADVHQKIYTQPRYRRAVYRSLMTTMQQVLGFDLSDDAKFRLHVLSVYYESGWSTVKVAFPQLTRPTLYRWKKAYEGSGRRLNALVPKSTRPGKTRQMTVPVAIVVLVTELRKQYPRMGKAKLKRFVEQFCDSEHVPLVSEATIGRVIKKHHLFFAGKATGRRKYDTTKKQRVKRCPKATDTKPGYIQLDGVKFYYLSRYYYFLTAVDIVSKQAWVKLVPSLKSKHAAAFLQEILQSAYYPMHAMQTDNGSEFKAYFDQAVQEANLTHLWSYPHHPKTNGYVERFNWTIQDEFLFQYEDLLLYPTDFQQELTNWLVFYHTIRPHQSLHNLTPYEYLKKGGLSQMS